MGFLDDLLRGGDADRIAENPWGNGQGPTLDLPEGDDSTGGLRKVLNWHEYMKGDEGECL